MSERYRPPSPQRGEQIDLRDPAERPGQNAAGFRFFTPRLEASLVDVRYVRPSFQIDPLDRRQSADQPQVDTRQRVDRARRFSVRGASPCSVSASESAIEKQAACAAARSSSGLVAGPVATAPGNTASNRELNE
jgi:hypothetical protein